MRGVRVCSCGCVYASQKYGRSPRSSFCHFVPKLSRCSLIFAPRGWRLPPPVLFLQGRAGFVLSHKPDFHLSLTRFFTPAENQRFSPGDPEAPCVNSARRTDGARCAIPSLRSLQIRLAAPHSRKASLATPRKLCGVFAFCPTRKSEIFPAGTPFVPAALPHKVSSLCGGTLRGPRCVSAKEKCKTCAPLLVPLRCAGTIALLSDFCSAGWAAHAACSFFKDERVLCCRTNRIFTFR